MKSSVKRDTASKEEALYEGINSKDSLGLLKILYSKKLVCLNVNDQPPWHDEQMFERHKSKTNSIHVPFVEEAEDTQEVVAVSVFMSLFVGDEMTIM